MPVDVFLLQYRAYEDHAPPPQLTCEWTGDILVAKDYSTRKLPVPGTDPTTKVEYLPRSRNTAP